MEKRISFYEFQSVKAVAKAIDPHLRTLLTLRKKALALKEEFEGKKEKLQQELNKKTEKLSAELNACTAQVEALEAGILQVTGFHVNELVTKVIEPTGAVDKEGKPIKVTKYIPTSIVTYDEAAKQYVISKPEEGEEVPVQEETTVEETPAETPAEETPQEEPFSDTPEDNLPFM